MVDNPLYNYLLKISSHPYSRLLIQIEHAWIVLHSFSPANRILFELASNLYLPNEHQLQEQQLTQIKELGYKKRRGDRSLGTMTNLSSEEDIQRMMSNIAQIFTEVFQLSNLEYQFTFQEKIKHSLDNQKLHIIMKKLVRDKQHSNRIALYQALLNTQILVYMNQEEQLFPYDTISSLITYAAFTEDKYIQQFDPRGCKVQLFYTYQLLPLLLKENAGSLILNPRGDIRGELYKNELQSMATALRK